MIYPFVWFKQKFHYANIAVTPTGNEHEIVLYASINPFFYKQPVIARTLG